MSKHLEHRSNNAYQTILLVDGGKVVGGWMTTGSDQTYREFLAGGADLWEPTFPDETDPEAHGELVATRS